MDDVMKLIQPQVVIDATRQIGWPVDPMTLTSLGLILLACTALYAFPRTAVLGAILLTGYLGGAVASHADTAIHFSPMIFLASISGSSFGADSGFATPEFDR
jgi:hypothetical protein